MPAGFSGRVSYLLSKVRELQLGSGNGGSGVAFKWNQVLVGVFGQPCLLLEVQSQVGLGLGEKSKTASTMRTKYSQ